MAVVALLRQLVTALTAAQVVALGIGFQALQLLDQEPLGRAARAVALATKHRAAAAVVRARQGRPHQGQMAATAAMACPIV